MQQILTESQRLVRGIGDANPDRIFIARVTVTENQLTATLDYLQKARRQLANSILAPQCSPQEETEKTRILAVVSRIAGELETAREVRGVAPRVPGKRVA